ncbi:unnamed protein product [Hermetia illucens]|uniref:Uncharacterized protein n=1 Tax=Hermetia illucens TaxID=343691 RepID=A0A7R8UIM9_HERIL|nr:unnamed protein product [Hermetia illucens]
MVFTSLVNYVRTRGPDEFWRKRKISSCQRTSGVVGGIGRRLKKQDLSALWKIRTQARLRAVQHFSRKLPGRLDTKQHSVKQENLIGLGHLGASNIRSARENSTRTCGNGGLRNLARAVGREQSLRDAFVAKTIEELYRV